MVATLFLVLPFPLIFWTLIPASGTPEFKSRENRTIGYGLQPTTQNTSAAGQLLLQLQSPNYSSPGYGSEKVKKIRSAVNESGNDTFGNEGGQQPPRAAVADLKIDISLVANYNQFQSDNFKTVFSGAVCRHYEYLPIKLFALNSCAHCYNFVRDIPGLFGNPSRKWKMIQTSWTPPGKSRKYGISVLMSPISNLTVFANVSAPESSLLQSFANKDARRKWEDCCAAAEECCERIQQNEQSPGVAGAENRQEEKSCEPTWDGWQCWNETKAGKVAQEACPHYIYFAMTEPPSCTAYAEKACTPQGNWISKYNAKSNSLKEWTDYGKCGSAAIEALKRRTYVHVIAYSFSIVAILPSIIVFLAYKQLRVDRIILHRNLFTSMLINGIVVIAFKTFVILSELRNEASPNSIINQNGVGCRLLFILTKYSRMTNYMWMFCEGYYLHKLIAAAFAEQKTLLVFYMIGWVFPIIPTVIYAVIRLTDDELNNRCWVVPKESIEWIFNGPSLLSLLINMLFLINIIRVLVTKLRAAHANEPSQYRKAVRATLVLLPLFGLHFVITIYRPSSGSGACEWLEVYNHVNDVLDGLQGFLVALIFCYLNGEVINLVKRTYTRWREQHDSGGNRRQSSASRLRHRQSHGGSMMGRSVVSTQCYSSVPPSPEICGHGVLNRNGGVETTNMNVIGASVNLFPIGGGRSKSPTFTASQSPNGLGLIHLNSMVKVKSDDGSWAEIELGDSGSVEGKHQKHVKLSPPTVMINTTA